MHNVPASTLITVWSSSHSACFPIHWKQKQPTKPCYIANCNLTDTLLPRGPHMPSCVPTMWYIGGPINARPNPQLITPTEQDCITESTQRRERTAKYSSIYYIYMYAKIKQNVMEYIVHAFWCLFTHDWLGSAPPKNLALVVKFRPLGCSNRNQHT